MSYRIITDSCCDLPPELLAKMNVTIAPLTLLFRGESRDDAHDETLPALYAALRKGEAASTSAVNPSRWEKTMEPFLAQGEDLLVLAFSSGLSTTFQSANIAAEELRRRYPQRQISVVDTLSASLGQGLLVWYACKKQAEGLSLGELTAWCEENKGHLCHWFTVDDLMYLKRGGRIGAGTALLGTMLGIKPVLHMDDAGHLVNVSKARGRKAAIEALVQKLTELGAGFDNSAVFISHGDCPEDAAYLARRLRQQCGVEQVITGYVGAVIGSHSGPGTLALFFLGKHR